MFRGHVFPLFDDELLSQDIFPEGLGLNFTLRVNDPVAGHVALFAVGDILRMKAFNGTTVLDNWMTVQSVNDPGGAEYFEYVVGLNSGTPGTFPKGTAIVNYGQAGDGAILLTSDASMSPYLDVFTHAGAPWTTVTPRVRLGNLDGVLGLSEQWGIALGYDLTDVTAAARYIVASDQQVALHNIDLALYNGASQSVELTNAGRLKIGTNIAAAATTELYFNPAAATYNSESLAAGTLLLGDNTSGEPNLKVNDTDIRFRRGTTTHLLIDGTNIIVGQVGAGLSNILITAGEIDLRTNTTVKISLDTSGNINLTGELIVGTAGDIRSGATAVLTGNGYWLDYNGGTPRFRVGTITGGALDEGIYWDGANIQLYSGTGSFGSPTTGLKIYTNATIGVLESWGAGVKQVYLDTDGKFYAGAGAVTLDSSGINIAVGSSVQNSINWKSGSTVVADINTLYSFGSIAFYRAKTDGTATHFAELDLQAFGGTSAYESLIRLAAKNGTATNSLIYFQLNAVSAMVIKTTGVTIDNGLNVGTATGAGTGEIKTSGAITVTTTSYPQINIDAASGTTSAAIDMIAKGASARTWRLISGSDGVFTLYDFTGSASRIVVNASGHVLPGGAGTQNFGDASNYWNDISYKTLTDRGCLGWFDNGVEMPDGSLISDTEALLRIRKHPTLETVYGVPRLDYATMPRAVYRPAFGKGEDGAETTALISIMLGAIRELTGRVVELEGAMT